MDALPINHYLVHKSFFKYQRLVRLCVAPFFRVYFASFSLTQAIAMSFWSNFFQFQNFGSPVIGLLQARVCIFTISRYSFGSTK